MNTLLRISVKQPLLRSAFILATLGSFALLHSTSAVSPLPDGGYPGGNTAEGESALFNLSNTGIYNTAVGWFALSSDIDGKYNTAIGAGTLLASTAEQNTATGAGALLANTSGRSNTANGAFALLSNTQGSDSTATGDFALSRNTTGNHNTATGAAACFSNTTGSSNTAIGDSALLNSTGSNDTALGFTAGNNVTTANNVICIGSPGQNVDNSCYIGNISGADATGGDAVFITTDGKLGTVNPPSSARYKEEIEPMNQASEAILALKPVTFRYKKEFDPNRMQQFGLVAEDVEKVNPNLVKRDRDGRLQTVRYDAVNAMLLNEFLKEHQKVKQLETVLNVVNRRLEEQARQIQKVSAQIEISKSVQERVVGNKR
jgi:hypothetical protein